MENRNSKIENGKSKLIARNVTPAQAGVHEVMDSRFRGNDPLHSSLSFEFRFSSFDSHGRLCGSDI
jgi:hypothetical protein